jgi:polysaccharide biosynthesis protein PslH
MGNLLYLVHRLPYPPNKGDKVRSFHLLKHLTSRHRVFLGTFLDDPADASHVETVREMCPDLHVARLDPRLAKVRSLRGLITNEALGLGYYRDPGLHAWVSQTLAENDIAGVVVFSSVMAQYFNPAPGEKSIPMLVDFVDVDSEKWTQYAARHHWPMSWLYRREGRRLLTYERWVAKRAHRSFFVTDHEVALFHALAPESVYNSESMSNGVDAEFFAPDPARLSPFPVPSLEPSSIALVFTGAMDYWPNIDAVSWFVHDVLPALRVDWPQLVFYIVGRSPQPSVLALACDSVVVTGTVPDVRPYLQHASVVVAPLRVARGIQNKILEAMAMSRPVVAARSCVEVIQALPGKELIQASEAPDYVREIDALLKSPMRAASVGASGRQRVVKSFSWDAHLGQIDRYLDIIPNRASVQ